MSSCDAAATDHTPRSTSLWSCPGPLPTKAAGAAVSDRGPESDAGRSSPQGAAKSGPGAPAAVAGEEAEVARGRLVLLHPRAGALEAADAHPRDDLLGPLELVPWQVGGADRRHAGPGEAAGQQRFRGRTAAPSGRGLERFRSAVDWARTVQEMHRVPPDVAPEVEQLVRELRDELPGAVNLPDAVLRGPGGRSRGAADRRFRRGRAASGAGGAVAARAPKKQGGGGSRRGEGAVFAPVQDEAGAAEARVLEEEDDGAEEVRLRDRAEETSGVGVRTREGACRRRRHRSAVPPPGALGAARGGAHGRAGPLRGARGAARGGAQPLAWLATKSFGCERRRQPCTRREDRPEQLLRQLV